MKDIRKSFRRKANKILKKNIVLCCLLIFLSMFFYDDIINYIQSTYYQNSIKNVYKNDNSDKASNDEKYIASNSESSNTLEDFNVNDSSPNNESNGTITDCIMRVHYIDVGQGDSIFIELPDKASMLIDAGESSKAQVVIDYIKNLGYSKIDYIIGTHPHADHIGGLAQVVSSFDIGKIYMPKAISTSKTYEKLLGTILEKGLKIQTARSDVNIINNDSLLADIIAPNSDLYDDLNNYSVVIKITYKNKKFIFMGDAEVQSENEISTNIEADVIKVGHHGSDTSSGETFVNKVKPKYAIISVGSNNSYNHPFKEIVDRWKNVGAKIYRTDLNGTIIITTNGNTIDIKTSK